jgi:nicotinamidase-related amidase
MLVCMNHGSIDIHGIELWLGNMFESNPDLATSLRMQGIEHLVFVGLQTDYCVRASILGAIASCFDASNITLLRGTHSTYDNALTGKSYQEVKTDVEQ